ncbi:MAG: ABC transporter permease, partial [Gemmatimonadales bacterium]
LALFLGLVYLVVVRVARLAARVKPADAIRYGAEAHQEARGAGMPWRRIRNLAVPVLLAIKNLGLSRRRAAFLCVSVGFATVAAALAVNLDHSFQQMRTDLAPFGFDGANVRVSRTGRRFGMRHEALMEALASRPDVGAVATWDPLDGTVWLPATGFPQTTMGIVVDGDMEGLRYGNLRGRNPSAAGEVSLAIRTAADLAKDLGDTVQINLLGVTLDLVVTGVYQSINNTGHGFRIRLDAVKVADPLWRPSQYGVALAPGVDPDRFMAELEREYGEAVDAKPGDYFIRDQLDAILAGLRLANGFLAAVFLLAASIFIVNTTLLTIAENRRMFGILKTVGMTPAELRSSVVYGALLLAVLGVLAGLLLWWLAAPPALSAFFSQVGLVSFPLRHSLVGMAVAVAAILGFAACSAWMPSRRVLTVNPRNLIVE